MDKDPDRIWPGGFPYDALSPAGIDSYSSMKAIRTCRGYLIEQGLMDEVSTAYDALNTIDKRLLVDFFLYRTALPADAGEDGHGC